MFVCLKATYSWKKNIFNTLCIIFVIFGTCSFVSFSVWAWHKVINRVTLLFISCQIRIWIFILWSISLLLFVHYPTSISVLCLLYHMWHIVCLAVQCLASVIKLCNFLELQRTWISVVCFCVLYVPCIFSAWKYLFYFMTLILCFCA